MRTGRCFLKSKLQDLNFLILYTDNFVSNINVQKWWWLPSHHNILSHQRKQISHNVYTRKIRQNTVITYVTKTFHQVFKEKSEELPRVNMLFRKCNYLKHTIPKRAGERGLNPGMGRDFEALLLICKHSDLSNWWNFTLIVRKFSLIKYWSLLNSYPLLKITLWNCSKRDLVSDFA